ncbi:MAG: hypothetical protein KDJ37_13610 [Hyphomicrobiaceae bacterium]|nr:hypothetical protein [Hyphomicrobiaceae bacterium]
MDRRDFLKRTGAAALTASAIAAADRARAADRAAALANPVAAPAILGARRRLRLVSNSPDTVSGPGDAIRRFCARVHAATDGRWTIDVAADARDGLEAVMLGEADLYVASETAHAAMHPALAYFGGLPIRDGLGAQELAAWITVAGGQQLWDDLAAEFNVKAMLMGHTGTCGLFMRQPRANGFAMTRLRIAADGLSRDVLAALGAEPLTIAGDHRLEALAAGHLDGAEAPDASAATVMAYARVSHHAIVPGLVASGAGIAIGMRRSFWDGLSNSEQILVQALSSEAYALAVADLGVEAAALRAHSALGATAVTAGFAGNGNGASGEIDAAQRAALWRVGADIVAAVAAFDGHARRIAESYALFRALRRESISGAGRQPPPIA